MFKKFTQIFFCSLLVLSFISCKKDTDSSPVSSGTAVYTLEGAPSICSSPVIAGLYGAGVAMTAANTVTLTANVTGKGTYSIRTTSANGVYFAGGGTFSGTGSQTIILTAAGTPAREGNFGFVPGVANTCNFSVSFANGLPPAVFTYTNCSSATAQGTYTTGVALDGSNYIDLGVNVTSPGTYTIVTNSANGFSFSASGGFSATGAQSVRLIANGTPAAATPTNFTPTSGCQFTVAVAAPLPPATFTCTGAIVNGTYAAGTVLNATNTVTLTLNVTVAGSYNITTTSASNNGVTFSGTGNVAVGTQTVTLRSTSLPTAAGTFNYTPTGGGCPFDVTYAGAPPPPTIFIKCKIAGTLVNFNTGIFSSSDQSGSPYSFSTTGDNSDGGTGNIAISLTDAGAAIASGGVYKNLSLGNTSKGCIVTYSPTGVLSTSSYFTSISAANSFTVTITNITATTATGTFSGTLYDNTGMGPGTKVISEGSFTVTF